MPFNKQKYRITAKDRNEISADTLRDLDTLLMRVAKTSNIVIKVELDVKSMDTIVTIGKRSPVNA